MRIWADLLARSWPSLHIGDSTASNSDGVWRFSVPVFLGEAPAASVRIELFADAEAGKPAQVIALHREREIPGSANGFIYAGEVKATRPAGDYTVRAVPDHPGAFLPSELPLIAWQR
jgi:starch phosphorylase